MRPVARGIVGLATIVFLTGATPAEFWTATKLRGIVEQQIDGQWQPLARGDVVPDARAIRSSSNGRVEFQRGQETVDLGPGTEIQIHDRPGQQYTVVSESIGTVSVEADVRNVNHFEVDTPFLAAVVKGTVFEVTTGAASATVSVSRGRVAVSDASHHEALVAAGQIIRESGNQLVLSGRPTGAASTATEDQPDASSASKDLSDDQSSASSVTTGDDNGKDKDKGNHGAGNSGNDDGGDNGNNGNHGEGNNGNHNGRNGEG